MGFCGEAVAGSKSTVLVAALPFLPPSAWTVTGAAETMIRLLTFSTLRASRTAGAPQPEILRLGVRAQDMLATGM